MARRTNWWLEGWQYEETLGPGGRRGKKLVYAGEYYTFGLEKKARHRLKAGMLGLTLLLTAAYILTFTLTQSGAARPFIAAGMLMVIPIMYLLLGVGCLMPVGEKLTYRDYRGSVIRIRWTSIVIAVLAAICVLGEIIHVLAGAELVAGELWWLTGTGFCCLDSVVLALLEFRFHPRLIPPELV